MVVGDLRVVLVWGVSAAHNHAHLVGLTGARGTLEGVSLESKPGRFKLVKETHPRVLAALARIDAMSDEEIRALVRDEPPIVVEAGEALIADRRAEREGAAHPS
jgi:hypothetical protein